MSPSKNLPVELWMRVLEYAETDDYARPDRVKEYAIAIQATVPGGSNSGNNAAEAKAVEKLPLFERKTWKNTRSFYAINRNSRAAAIKLRLSRKLMLACRQPVVWETPLSLPPAQLPTRPLRSLNQLKSRDCAVIQLSIFTMPFRDYGDGNDLLSRSSVRSPRWRQLLSNFCRNDLDFCRNNLAKIRRVVFLAPETGPFPDWFKLYAMSDVKKSIEQYWDDQGVRGGEVELWL